MVTSSGFNVAGAIKLFKSLGPKSKVVVVACDTGLKYLSEGLFINLKQCVLYITLDNEFYRYYVNSNDLNITFQIVFYKSSVLPFKKSSDSNFVYL